MINSVRVYYDCLYLDILKEKINLVREERRVASFSAAIANRVPSRSDGYKTPRNKVNELASVNDAWMNRQTDRQTDNRTNEYSDG